MKKICLILFLSLVLSTFSYSQSNILGSGNYTISSLTSAEQSVLNSFKSDSMYTTYYPVELNSLIESQVNGILSLDIPGDNCSLLSFEAESVEYVSEEDYYWHGTLVINSQDPCYCKLGTLTLISTGSSFIGHISIDNQVFEILSLSQNKFILGKVDNNKFTTEECGIDSIFTGNGTQGGASLRNDGHCPVRCVVAYTPLALAAEGNVPNIEARAELAIRQTNQALRNSHINSNQLEIELVGVVANNINVEASNSIRADLHNYVANPAQMNAILNNNDADILVFLTDGNYGGTFGIAYVFPWSANWPVAFVQTGASTTARLTFAHEVGHLFGAEHNDNGVAGIAHGHNFKTGNFLPCIFGSRQRTLLNRADENDSRILHYSNPNVYYDSKETGIEDERDNAQVIKNNACRVANFHDGPHDNLRVSFNTEYDINKEHFNYYTCPCDYMNVEASITGGAPGPYVIEWSYSFDNGTTFSTLSNSSSTTMISMWEICPVQDGEWCFESCLNEKFILKIDVEAQNSETATYERTFKFKDYWNIKGNEVTCQNEFEGFVSNSNNRYLAAFPNPSS